jgi:hypothetical protein
MLRARVEPVTSLLERFKPRGHFNRDAAVRVHISVVILEFCGKTDPYIYLKCL